MITVIIIDDSATIRTMFTSMLSKDPQIHVIASAHDPFDAREKIRLHNPDVVTLDIEMPKMDGLSFLEKIMALRPMPVVMASTLTTKGADATLKALELGAVDYVAKPVLMDAHHLALFEAELIEKVRHAARANIKAAPKVRAEKPTMAKTGHFIEQCLIGIAASTGGVEAIRDVICRLPKNMPPIVITQHMPALFTASFAKRLDSMSALHVCEAAHNMPIQADHVYVAPGGYHLTIRQKNTSLACALNDGPMVSGHRPAADVMFDSMSRLTAYHCIGAILTGMGSDGANGLYALRHCGGRTFGQSEASCVVYGMPRAARKRGSTELELPLNDIADRLIQLSSHQEERHVHSLT